MIKSPTKEIRAVDNHQGHENGRLGKKKKKEMVDKSSRDLSH